jgi:hypothetical protein
VGGGGGDWFPRREPHASCLLAHVALPHLDGGGADRRFVLCVCRFNGYERERVLCVFLWGIGEHDLQTGYVR